MCPFPASAASARLRTSVFCVHSGSVFSSGLSSYSLVCHDFDLSVARDVFQTTEECVLSVEGSLSLKETLKGTIGRNGQEFMLSVTLWKVNNFTL